MIQHGLLESKVRIRDHGPPPRYSVCARQIGATQIEQRILPRRNGRAEPHLIPRRKTRPVTRAVFSDLVIRVENVSRADQQSLDGLPGDAETARWAPVRFVVNRKT